jgi:hypothetical protein
MQNRSFYPLYLFLLLLPLNRDGLLSSIQYILVILSAHVLAALFMVALARDLAAYVRQLYLAAAHLHALTPSLALQ